MLVAVIYVALAFGPVAGLLAGSTGGLVQDALAGGIVGVGGFSKTLVGFLVGLLGAQFIVAQSLPRLVMFVSGTLVHELCYQALYALVETRRVPDALVGGVDAGRRQRPRRHPGLSDCRVGPWSDAAPALPRRYTK